MDVQDIMQGVASAKSAFDMMRTAVGLVSDVQKVLPKGEQADAIASAVHASERQLAIAEAQLASALGYELCRTHFPPVVMLRVGHQRSGQVVYECPTCKSNSAPGFNFTRFP